MKIRIGFVSNSSSSSFVAWGVNFSEIKFPDSYYLDKFSNELYRLSQLEKPSSWVKDIENEMLSVDTDEERIRYVKANLNDDYKYPNGFMKSGPPEGDDFIGLTPSYIMKNHPEITFGEVNKFVAEKLNETFGTNFTEKEVGYYEEGWYDG
jgi:hypothetical protein